MNSLRIIVPAVCAFWLLAASAHADLKEDLAFIRAQNPPAPPSPMGRPAHFSGETSELKLVLNGAIRTYQLFISSQDMSVCNFTPSCSHFTTQAVSRYGLFWGGLMAADRLQRCNGLGRKYYRMHPETGKCTDPVEVNYLSNK